VRELTLGQLAAQVRQRLDPSILLWLEVDTLEQLHAALEPGARGADIILLDNFTPEQMREAVRLRDAFLQRNPRNRILLEASGGITLANVGAIAQTGVDRISIGALTHSAPILDLSMEFVDQ
jgi:nicotinate-nucleotide pyrophosphorylase (carboxylating)